MRWVSGVPTGIFRDGDPLDPGQPQPYVLAKLNEGPQVRAYYMGEPPCPLLPAWFYSDGIRWWCHGSQGFVRPVLREHFTTVPTATADGLVACDTPWTLDVTGANSQIAALSGTGLGTARLTSGDAANRACIIIKDTDCALLSSADAHWVRTRVQGPDTNGCTASLGLVSAAGTNITCGFANGTGSHWRLVVNDGSDSTSNSATVVTGSGFVWADLLLAPGVFGALWVNGDGPYFATTHVPTASDSLRPRARITSAASATRTLDLDCIFFDAVDGDLVHPEDPFLKP